MRGTRKEPEIRTAAELMALDLPEISWIIPVILPSGVTILAGKVKMGKSWMVLAFSIAVATGGVVLGTMRVERGEVLYLALEDNWRRLKKRLRKLLNGGVEPDGLHIATDWPRADEGGVEKLDEWLENRPDCRLVVIDTLARFKPRATGRRSQYDEDRDKVDPLIPIAAQHNVAIVIVHHLRETESDDPLDMIHDTAGLTGGADGALVLKRKRGKANANLHVDGRDIENPTELALTFDQKTATWADISDTEEYKSETRRKIIEAAVEWPAGPKEVADKLGMPENTIKQRMYQMSKDGDLKVPSLGLYEPP